MIHIPSDPTLFFIDWSSNALILSGLGVPIYFVIRRAGKGLLGGALWFWLCITAALFLREYSGEDMDMAPGCYLVVGWLVGLIYCLPTLAIVSAWRAWRPNPAGYCHKCGRAIRADQDRCPAGHSSANQPRGFEVIL